MLKETIPNCSQKESFGSAITEWSRSRLYHHSSPQVIRDQRRVLWFYCSDSEDEVYAVKIHCPQNFLSLPPSEITFYQIICSNPRTYFENLYFHIWHSHYQETVLCVFLGKFKAWKEECHILLGIGHNNVIWSKQINFQFQSVKSSHSYEIFWFTMTSKFPDIQGKLLVVTQ